MIRRRRIENESEGIGDEEEVGNAETGLGEDDHGIDGEAADGAGDGEAEVTEGGDLSKAVRRFEPAADRDQKQHAVIGDGSNGKDHEGTEDPTGLLEGVGKAKDAGAHHCYEDVGKGLGLGGKGLRLADQRRVFPWESMR